MPPSKRVRSDDDDDSAKNIKKAAVSQSSKSDEDLGENWRDKCSGVLASQAYALKKSILTDVTFMVGPENAVCHAHRLILALASPVFEAMFFGSLAEKGDMIRIPDISADGFRHLLRYIYSQDITFKNDVEAFKSYLAADKYCVTNLKLECDKYLTSCELTPSNIWTFLESSLFLNSVAISNRCMQYLKFNTEIALQHEGFLDVSIKTIENLMCLDSLNISEMKLLLNVLKWAENKCEVPFSECSFQSIMTPLLPLIRFGALTTTQFINFIDCHNDLLEDKEALSILKHICQPSTCALPEWCNSKTWRQGNLRCQIRCKIRPGSPQSEKMIRIAHYLTNKNINSMSYSECSNTSSSSFSSSSSSSSSDSSVGTE